MGDGLQHLLNNQLCCGGKRKRSHDRHCAKMVHKQAGNHVLCKVQENLVHGFMLLCDKHGGG
eukprot:3322293-Amphidinium_carterae.2